MGTEQKTQEQSPRLCKAFLPIKKGRAYIRVPLSDIEYFSIEKKIIHIHKCDGEVLEMYGRMYMIEQILDPDRFYRCQDSYIVNDDYVVKYEYNTLTMVSGEVIPVGKIYKNEVKNRFMTYLYDDAEK